MKNKILFAIGLVFSLQSCIPSLHPLYTEDTLVFEEALLGTWTDGPNQIWEFVKEGDNHYQLTYTENEKPVKYEVHLVQLGDTHFFDFYLDEKQPTEDYAIAPLIPSHSFAKVTWEKDRMDIAFFDYEWLEKLFQQRKIRLEHEVIDDGTIILTASTEELQKFVQKYAHEEAAFIDPSRLQRRTL